MEIPEDVLGLIHKKAVYSGMNPWQQVVFIANESAKYALEEAAKKCLSEELSIVRWGDTIRWENWNKCREKCAKAIREM